MTRPAFLACRRILASRRASSIAQLPIRWIYFDRLLPYELALTMQEQLLAARLEALLKLEADPTLNDPAVRKTAETDLLLLLQHRPVYTTGRRETDQDVLASEGLRLRALGADYISTDRGGQTTYHGPGQLVGYPIFNMGATGMRTRTYVCLIQKFLENLLASYHIPVIESPHVGTFVDTNAKIASIGIQIRHRVTMHGFALNVEDSIQNWFANIVACGLTDVQATNMNAVRSRTGVAGEPLTVEAIVPSAVDEFGKAFNRSMAPFELDGAEPLTRPLRHILQTLA